MRKKNILLFSRSELTYLYGSLHKYLKESSNIIHVAYSQYEAAILKNEFGINDVIILKEITKKYLDCKVTHDDLEKIDQLLLDQTGGRFNLNAAIQSNRTSKFIGYEKSVQICLVYFNAWSEIFDKLNVDFFIHEPVSLMMNQIASALCKKHGGVYSTHIMVNGDSGDYNFLMVDDYNGQAIELQNTYNSITKTDIILAEQRISSFLEKFRSSYTIFFSSLGNGEGGFKTWIELVKAVVLKRMRTIVKRSRLNPVIDNIEYFLEKNDLDNRRIYNLKKYKEIQYDELDITLTYYFYPLHLEPEAVVLYWADGMYTNQVKLIENVAAQLPVGVFLYVKDHPHLYGYRDKIDYDRIQSIPNVKLLKPSISGKKVIKDCKGVITINGTGGFEALLMNKHVITIGSAFYNASERVIKIKNIKELREHLYNLKEVVFEDDDELYRFTLAYLLSQKKGFTDFYGNMHSVLMIDLENNARVVAGELSSFFNNYHRE